MSTCRTLRGFCRFGTAIVVAGTLASSSAFAETTAPAATAAGFEACQAENDEAFARAIEAVTVKAIGDELKTVDYDTAVSIEWARLGLDAIVDQRVDAAVAEVKASESWGSLIQSLGNEAKAQELATAVADKAYKSEAMQTAIENLATAVGEQAGKRIEMASEDAAKPALNCLRTFLGSRYGSAVAAAVSTTAAEDFGFEAGRAAPNVGSGSILKQSGEGLTGAAVLVLRRQLANMARRVGQRLAGSVLSRLVSVAAGGVGLVLIAKDLWELRHGVLPIIADEMKSKDSKEKVRQELVKGLTEEIGSHATEIGAASAAHVVEVWQQFKRAHAKALELAGRDAAFKTFMEGVAPSSFARLDEVMTLLLPAEGEDGVLKRAADGTLATAVNKLPEEGMTIARDTGSVAEALGWSAVAGSSLGRVLDLELYREAKPQDFTADSLEKVLAVEDRQAAQHLAAIDRAQRDTLLTLERAKLEPLAHALDKTHLATLAGYLQELGPEPRKRVLEAVAANPAAMESLASPRVRRAVVGSADQTAAVDMMLRPAGATSWQTVLNDLEAASEGRIRPSLLLDRYPLLVAGAGVLALFVLLWLRRLFRPPPATPSPPKATAA